MPIETSPRIMHSGRKRSATKTQTSTPADIHISSSPLAKHPKTSLKNAPEYPIVEEEDKENVFIGVSRAGNDPQHLKPAKTAGSSSDAKAVDQTAMDTDSKWAHTRQ